MTDRNRLMALTILAAGLGLTGSALAQTSCATPKAPAPVAFAVQAKPEPPAKPACVDSGKCKKPEADAYNAAIAKFNADATVFEAANKSQVGAANDYIHQLNAYGAAVQDYVNCEHKRVVAIVDAQAQGPKP